MTVLAGDALVRSRGDGGKTLPQPTEDAGGNHVVHRPAELEDVADDAAGKVRIFGVGHDEEGLDLRGQLTVHQGHLELVLEVGHGAQPADDGTRLLLPQVVDQQAREVADRDVGQVAQRLSGHGVPLLDAERGTFLGVDQNADLHLVEDRGGAFGNIDVPVGDGIERAGVDGLKLGLT